MRSLAAALCLSWVCCPSQVQAQDGASTQYSTQPPQSPTPLRARVILVQPSADSSDLAEAPTRIRAELEAAGFEVEVVAGDATLGPREQLERAEQQGAVGPTPIATILLAAAGNGADIWIADRVTSKTSVRRIEIKAGSQGASILAVRTVELLRASLLETRQSAQLTTATAPHAVDASDENTEAPEPDETEAESEAEAGAVAAMDLGLLGLWGLSGIRPQVGPSLRVSLGSRSIKGRLTLAAPILGERLETTQGAARVQPLIAQLDVVASFPVQKNTRLYGSLGFGGYLLRARGEADAPAIAHDETATGIAFQMGMGLQVQTSRRLNLFIEPQLIWMLPEVVIRIADREAGRLGQPAIGSTIGLTWTF